MGELERDDESRMFVLTGELELDALLEEGSGLHNGDDVCTTYYYYISFHLPCNSCLFNLPAYGCECCCFALYLSLAGR